MKKKISRKDQLIKSQFNMISTTGKISGDVKELLVCKDKEIMLKNIESININLKDLIIEIYEICKSLNIDFKDLLGGIED